MIFVLATTASARADDRAIATATASPGLHAAFRLLDDLVEQHEFSPAVRAARADLRHQLVALDAAISAERDDATVLQ